MKKAFYTLLIAGIMCWAEQGFANMERIDANKKISACMLDMSPVILIDKDMRDFNFVKSPRIDAFFNSLSDEKMGKTSQYYRNAFCEAKVEFSHHEYGRLSRAKLKRVLKNKAPFTISRQDNLKIGKTHLVSGYAQNEDFSQTLTFAPYQDMLLKIHTVCSKLDRFDEEEYALKIKEMNTIFAESILSHFKDCAR